ncbi:Met-10+ like family protein / kelch repeat-containing protein [Arabidopsis thaliana]|uniref:tRNA wybutosine-synthesizing protein 2/3/4 n=1 Tax=Arabidopsis thaliana TaxID=3702 RepID=TYW23_ARATH|nr:Met-10+ like family protein / kelch repeat-containing protein [Arabidopsis thaliana]Q8W4K1.1 RecName: Full=tRNA wybutosine-synthesizing protein 2/3/4; Includes: RecName: Full=tRNA wybutosine-synthesizing protein 3 homolog; Short=tRNA-yW-synthesizing protein 3; AltName: Full=tRNA(Phe) 7-((3-amino-3-carboxypropyl)-4-demethylwyosine(37)-N(4))-methyltransferase; Includes: RecName: Full=tRNA wybutosine-synthesizing protein 2 homolog; Short=tRNA-yW-synthesizing protein 2; AltName: Full=tRNA(Phe) (4-d|eukprot:NP_567268.2 Met-10+ like family protein / kelch repeat-containing protein [Arabidopsis thaliana]
MDFEKRKAATLASIRSSVTDKSPKGFLDEPIIPLLETINHHPSYFTTSSCSGRISILSQPKPKSNDSTKKKARGGSWLYITHDPADSDLVISLLFPSKSNQIDPIDQPSELVFRFEPLIIAVECKDLGSAQFLVALAISAGFRESGITSCGDGKRVIIAIRCSIRMEVPIGDTEKLMVSPEYVKFLVDIANEKMDANRKRTDGFSVALASNGFKNPDENDVDEDDNYENLAANHDSSINNGNLYPGVQKELIPLEKLSIVGEPVEKLHLWGHSACTIDESDRKEVIVFGGFGGFGRHARRNESLLLNPSCGTLKLIAVNESPSARLGHTASMVGDFMFVIGGRADPLNILNDVWRLDISTGEWSSQRCVGSEFPPRHRHAAASVGTKVYIFGGLYNDKIVSSMHILDTKDLQWKEVEQQGQWPCARHSHAMVAYGSQSFMFGGYNGENVLNDLYSFDVQSCSWKLEVISGKWPHARFSHSMFVYKHTIGIIGGCPVSQNCQELTLLDLKHRLWRSVRLEFMNKELFVRSTASILGDDLIVIGGGAACYAFGTKFSEPVKINLVQSVTMSENHLPPQPEDVSLESNKNNADLKTETSLSQPWVIQLERKYAKFGKDILKSFGWLDLERKVYSNEKGLCICFPVTENFSELFHEKQLLGKDFERSEENNLTKGLSLKDISCSAALNLLKEHGAKKLINVAFEAKKVAKSPLQRMREDITSILKQKGLPEELLDELPQKWERLGDIVVVPATSFKDPTWSSINDEVWCAVSKSLSANRLARQGRVEPNGTRDSTLEILVGDNGWVNHRENGILYSFDATKCMFSWGNLSEKLRMGNMACENEVVVDLFAGIGYFVLPFLVRAKAKLVYACEWNPHAIEALRRNVEANSVSERCIILEGDNRITAPKGVADRVNLGLIPSSEGSWVTAIQALRPEGGILHVHGNVKDSDESSWGEHVTKTLSDIARAEGRSWEVTVEHIEKVKWYAPRIRHLVADVRCR